MTEKKSRVQKNWLEWSVFGVSLVLVACTLGFLIYDGATSGYEPPALSVELGTPEQRAGHFVVPLTVRNGGGQTAEGVTVEVMLERDASPAERGEFTVAFLPRGGRREGFVTFRSDPRTGRLVPHVLGYEKP